MSEEVTRTSKELSRCPHCGATAHGGTVHIEGSKFDRYVGASYVVCDHSLGGCGASGGFRDNQDEAIALWNRRAALEPPAKPVAWRGVLDSAYELHPRYVYSDSQPERGEWEPLYAAPPASAPPPGPAPKFKIGDAVIPTIAPHARGDIRVRAVETVYRISVDGHPMESPYAERELLAALTK
jgi:hypothetical protein